jgi:hypothetical protein
VRGASALESALGERRDDAISVLVVWEPVLWTDWSAPSRGLLARISDRRAAQFWDRGRLVSDRIRADYTGDRREIPDIVWDVVYVFPKGTRWEGAFPSHTFADGPVVRVMKEFRKALAATLGSATVN